MLKLTPGVNFINVSRADFVHVDPKSVKNWGFDWILTLSGSSRVKAVRRTLMKLSPVQCHTVVDLQYKDVNCISNSIGFTFAFRPSSSWFLFLIKFWYKFKFLIQNFFFLFADDTLRSKNFYSFFLQSLNKNLIWHFFQLEVSWKRLFRQNTFSAPFVDKRF